MAKKNNAGRKRPILNYILILPALFNLIMGTFSLIRSEISMIRKRIILLFILAVFCLVILLSLWLCGTGLILIYLLSIPLSLAESVTLIFVLNLLLLVISALSMALVKVDLSLPETREALRELVSEQ